VNALERAWTGSGSAVRIASASSSRPSREARGTWRRRIALTEWVAGCALEACGRDRDAHAHLEASLASARRAADRARECRALYMLGLTDTLAGRTDAARSYAATALEIARETGDRNLEARTRNTLGNVEEIQGHLQEAVTQYTSALVLAQAIDDKDLEGSIRSNLANVLSLQGRGDEARIADGGSDRRRAAGGQPAAGRATRCATSACCTRCRAGTRGRSSPAARRWRSRVTSGNVRLECVALCNVGMAYDSLGRFDDARVNYEAAVALARQLGDHRQEASSSATSACRTRGSSDSTTRVNASLRARAFSATPPIRSAWQSC
jgi:tetratricopeptide (TPR) repeat protein